LGVLCLHHSGPGMYMCNALLLCDRPVHIWLWTDRCCLKIAVWAGKFRGVCDMFGLPGATVWKLPRRPISNVSGLTLDCPSQFFRAQGDKDEAEALKNIYCLEGVVIVTCSRCQYITHQFWRVWEAKAPNFWGCHFSWSKSLNIVRGVHEQQVLKAGLCTRASEPLMLSHMEDGMHDCSCPAARLLSVVGNATASPPKWWSLLAANTSLDKVWTQGQADRI